MVGMMVRNDDVADPGRGKTQAINPFQYLPVLGAIPGVNQSKPSPQSQQVYIGSQVGLVPDAADLINALYHFHHGNYCKLIFGGLRLLCYRLL
jgi:hypothetical protein